MQDLITNKKKIICKNSNTHFNENRNYGDPYKTCLNSKVPVFMYCSEYVL